MESKQMGMTSALEFFSLLPFSAQRCERCLWYNNIITTNTPKPQTSHYYRAYVKWKQLIERRLLNWSWLIRWCVS